jgi:chemotaxis-related protein WspD
MSTSHEGRQPSEDQLHVAMESALLTLLRRPIDAEVLRRNGELAATKLDRSVDQMRTVIVFRVGGELFALPAARLRRADERTTVRPIPHRRAGHLRGLCAVRGEIALCIDLRVVLDMPPAEGGTATTAHHRTLVLGDAGRPWAVEVDQLLGVHSVERGSLRPPPATAATGPSAFVEALFDLGQRDERRTVALLDADRLFLAMERGLS